MQAWHCDWPAACQACPQHSNQRAALPLAPYLQVAEANAEGALDLAAIVALPTKEAFKQSVRIWRAARSSPAEAAKALLPMLRGM